ncbi:MAG: hypothetical protein KA914_14795, partial [Ottowia sp.]|nr:hypothetical protein [Ottowia sp.]
LKTFSVDTSNTAGGCWLERWGSAWFGSPGRLRCCHDLKFAAVQQSEKGAGRQGTVSSLEAIAPLKT